MLFFCGHVAVLGGRCWAAAPPVCWALLAYVIFPACASPRGPVPQSVDHRLSGRSGAEGLRAWRPDRCRARRGHHQVSHSRRAFRFHLRGGGRGVRPDALRRDRAAVLRADRAAVAARGQCARSLSRNWRARGLPSSRPCRPSSIWAWRCQPAAGQGHDAALHLLWRLVALRGGADHGLRAGRHPPAAQQLATREDPSLRVLWGARA